MNKMTKNNYLAGFSVVVVLLALLRFLFPGLTAPRIAAAPSDAAGKQEQETRAEVRGAEAADEAKTVPYWGSLPVSSPRFFDANGAVVKHRIFSVPKYSKAFPDSNYVQLASAVSLGVTPVANRRDAEARKKELVYMGASPYYHVDPMRQSIPYLVPRATVLLQDIGRNFYDSLQLKGIPLHQIIVTSVLRTQEDVERLRRYNKNATENSCHLYGTTFDIAYNRYKTVEAPGETRRAVRNDSLKFVLAEVLNDMRLGGRCYVKYEVRQGCFHVTTR